MKLLDIEYCDRKTLEEAREIFDSEYQLVLKVGRKMLGVGVRYKPNTDPTSFSLGRLEFKLGGMA